MLQEYMETIIFCVFLTFLASSSAMLLAREKV